MNRNFRRVLVFVAGTSLAAIPALFSCAASDGPPACNALANCCMNGTVPDPSSCSETAQSGYQTDAQCGATLAMYVASNSCLEDGAAPPVAEAGGH